MSPKVKEYSYQYAPTLKRFSESNTFLRAIVGPFGSGKSSACVIEIARRAMRQLPGPDGVRRTRWSVIRHSYPVLKDTTIPTFLNWLGDFGTYKQTENNFYLDKLPSPDGIPIHAIVHFRPLDKPQDIRNLLSLEVTGAWFNEAKEVPLRIVQAMIGRVGRFPPKTDTFSGATWSGIWMDTNPPDTDHWFYKLFEEEKPKRCAKCRDKHGGFVLIAPDGKCPKCNKEDFIPLTEIFRQPSGLSDEAENIPYLPPNYYQNLCVGASQEFINVYVHGQYGYIADGQPVFTSYDDEKHLAKEKLVAVPRIPIIVSFDNTGLNQAAVISQYMPNGQFRVLHEFLVREMGTRRFIRNIVRPFLLSHYTGAQFIFTGDPAGVRRSDTDERNTFDELREAGMEAIPARTNAWNARFSAVDSLLNRYLGKNTWGFLLSPECKMLRRGFLGEYRIRRLQIVGQERYANRPEKNEVANLHDALQYGALIVEDMASLHHSRFDEPDISIIQNTSNWQAWT